MNLEVNPKPRGNPNWVKRPTTLEEGVPVAAETKAIAPPSKITSASSENEDLRRAMCREVMRRVLAGQKFAAKGSDIYDIEVHSADLDMVYVFKENRGNGDKRNCKAVPIWEFCEDLGIEVRPEPRLNVLTKPMVSGDANVNP